MQPYMLELIALGIILIGVIGGAARGLLMTLYSLVKVVLIVALGIMIFPVVKVMLPANMEWGEGAAALISLVVAVIFMNVLAMLLKVIDKIPVLKTLNRLGGGILGGILGALVVVVALVVICYSRQAQWCQTIYPALMESRIFTGVYDLLKNAGVPFL